MQPSLEVRVGHYMEKLNDEKKLMSDPQLMARLGLVSPRSTNQAERGGLGVTSLDTVEIDRSMLQESDFPAMNTLLNSSEYRGKPQTSSQPRRNLNF